MNSKQYFALVVAISLCAPGTKSRAAPEGDVRPDDLSALPSGSDGIIGRLETLDAPVLQSHLNAGRDPSADILSTYFLRDHITTQVEAFKYLGSEQESFLPWALPLTSHSKVVDHEIRLVKYNIEKRKVPYYKYNYKYVTKTIYVREGGSGGGTEDTKYTGDKRARVGKLVKRQVRTRELVSVKQVGVRTEKVKVIDPNGKYEEELRVPVWESTGLARLPHGWHAANAQLVFTMLKAGLPATDPQVKLTIQSFNNLLFAYGIPDTTEDVAWLTALYANLPQVDPDVKEWSRRLVSRLVSGAAQVGDQQGMWGPVCVNPKYLNEILESDTDFVAKYITPLEAEIRLEARARTKGRLEQELLAKQRLYEQWQQVYLTWAMAGNAAANPRAQTINPAYTDNQKQFVFNYSLQVPGLIQDPYHFQFTDIESTCVALLGLSEARAAGILPARTLVPSDHRGKALGKPLEVRDLLSACRKTLGGLRQRSGGWDSCYSVKYHGTCRELPYASALPKDVYDGIKSENHWAYHVMGLAGMEYLARMADASEAQRIRTGSADDQAKLIQWLLEHTAELDLPNAPAKGDMLFFLADVIGSRNPDSQFLWQQIGAMGLSEPKGAANLDATEVYESYSGRKALDVEREFFKGNGPNPGIDGIEAAASPLLVEQMRLYRITSLSERAALTYFLARGIRQPVFAAVRPGGGGGTLPALDYAMNTNSGGIPLNYFYVSSANDLPRYSTSLFLVMERGGDVALTEMEKDNLTDYISGHGGTVVLLGVPGKGTEFIEKELSEMLTGAGLEHEVEVGSNRGCRCAEYRVDHQLAAIVLDVSPDQTPRDAYSKRLKVYKSLMAEKLPENYMKESYCLLPERVSNGELTLTGVEWESADGNININR